MCSSLYKIFCRTWCSAQQQGHLSYSILGSKSGQSPFITGGFGNWRKALKDSESMREVKCI